jgi:hypothetical protein
MQGHARDQRDLLGVESVAGYLLEPGSMSAFLAEHRRRLFPAGTYSRTSFRVVGVGREAADAVRFDLRWQAAWGGISIDAGSFRPSTLTYRRRRLAASQQPLRIFEVKSIGVARRTARLRKAVPDRFAADTPQPPRRQTPPCDHRSASTPTREPEIMARSNRLKDQGQGRPGFTYTTRLRCFRL